MPSADSRVAAGRPLVVSRRLTDRVSGPERRDGESGGQKRTGCQEGKWHLTGMSKGELEGATLGKLKVSKAGSSQAPAHPLNDHLLSSTTAAERQALAEHPQYKLGLESPKHGSGCTPTMLLVCCQSIYHVCIPEGMKPQESRPWNQHHPHHLPDLPVSSAE